MSTDCRQDNCTVGETGTCLLNNDPATCPNRILAGSGTIDVVGVQIAPLKEPTKHPRFPLSLSQAPAQVREMMGGRYCRLIGILGAPDAGKTAALVSLYLLLSRDQLKGMHFADSRSLMAFDEISQGARRWNEGKLPDQMTVHTELAEDRGAGFLHLRLALDEEEAVDILLPDLPGEWTTALIEHSRVDRLQFLKSADVIWLMVDGRQLATPSTRQLALHRTKLLLQRLAALISPAPPLILVASRRDTAVIDTATLDELRSEATSHGLQISFMEIASFADEGLIAPGTGIRELVEASILRVADSPPFWPNHTAQEPQSRAMMRFKARGAA